MDGDLQTHMIQVVPAIIPHSKEQLEDEIRRVAKFAQIVQIDISDGVFTPYKTWPYNGRDTDFFDALKKEETGWPRWEDLEFEVHLMVKSPADVVLDWIHTGAGSIIAHVEADDFQKVVDLCRQNEVSVGVAIKPSTDISKLEPFVSQVDFIQVMGSDLLGKHGVTLENKAVEMIRRLHQLYPERIIAIDIGVNKEDEKLLVSAGATKLVSGSDILDAPNPALEFRNLESQQNEQSD